MAINNPDGVDLGAHIDGVRETFGHTSDGKLARHDPHTKDVRSTNLGLRDARSRLKPCPAPKLGLENFVTCKLLIRVEIDLNNGGLGNNIVL